MKRYLLLCLTLAACSSVRIERPEIKGTIYDSISKTPIEEVTVFIDDEVKSTNSKGEFFIESVKANNLFNVESGHDPIFFLIKLKHPYYKNMEIKKGTRGSFPQERIVYDSIFLQPINQHLK